MIVWSDPRPPTKDVSHYDHIVATTPLGELRIEWKGWKEHDAPLATMPWGEFIIGCDLDETKKLVQESWDKKAAQIAAMSD